MLEMAEQEKEEKIQDLKEEIMEVRYSMKDISEENLLIFKEYALTRPVS